MKRKKKYLKMVYVVSSLAILYALEAHYHFMPFLADNKDMEKKQETGEIIRPLSEVVSHFELPKHRKSIDAANHLYVDVKSAKLYDCEGSSYCDGYEVLIKELNADSEKSLHVRWIGAEFRITEVHDDIMPCFQLFINGRDYIYIVVHDDNCYAFKHIYDMHDHIDVSRLCTDFLIGANKAWEKLEENKIYCDNRLYNEVHKLYADIIVFPKNIKPIIFSYNSDVDEVPYFLFDDYHIQSN